MKDSDRLLYLVKNAFNALIKPPIANYSKFTLAWNLIELMYFNSPREHRKPWFFFSAFARYAEIFTIPFL